MNMFASWASEGAENCMKPCKQSIMKCLKCLLQQQQMRRCNSSFAGRTECPSRAAQLSRSHLSDTMINNYPCPPNGLRWPTKPNQTNAMLLLYEARGGVHRSSHQCTRHARSQVQSIRSFDMNLCRRCSIAILIK